jgi:hypothetical protein
MSDLSLSSLEALATLLLFGAQLIAEYERLSTGTDKDTSYNCLTTTDWRFPVAEFIVFQETRRLSTGDEYGTAH